MTLEYASYIAGIVAAVAAVGSAYIAWHQHRKAKRPRSEVVAPPSGATSIREGEPAILVSAETYDLLVEKKAEIEVPQDVPPELLFSFSTAREMWNRPARDSALTDVARRSLELGRFDFAVAVAASMWNMAATDNLLLEIVDRSLEHSKFSDARAATELFFNLPKKDKAMNKIVLKANGREAASINKTVENNSVCAPRNPGDPLSS